MKEGAGPERELVKPMKAASGACRDRSFAGIGVGAGVSRTVVVGVGAGVDVGFSPAAENRCSPRSPPRLSTKTTPSAQKTKLAGIPGAPSASAAERSSASPCSCDPPGGDPAGSPGPASWSAGCARDGPPASASGGPLNAAPRDGPPSDPARPPSAVPVPHRPPALAH